jgi:hypothetical protein
VDDNSVNPSVPLPPAIRYPQDYSISNLTLLTPAGTWDFKSIMVELSYHEDLFNNTASGYLMVSESANFIETLHLNGNEFLRMTFSVGGNVSTQIDKVLRIYKMDTRKQENNMYTMSYALYFCSEEMLLNEQYKISKAYPNTEIYKNVLDILLNQLNIPPQKIANVEQTYGSYDFVIPTIKPFDAINWMSNYARPSSGILGSDMVFYEDKYGFNFRSLQSLMKNPVYHNYSYNPKNTDPSNLNSDEFNVLTYEFLNSFDTLGAINSGIFANQLISVDILTRTRKVTNFDYGAYQSDANVVKLNKNPITNQYTNRKKDQLNQTPQAVLKLIFSNFSQDSSNYLKQFPGAVAHNIYAETYIPYRTAQMSLSNYTRLKISVPGDSALTVGMVVGFSLKSNNPNNNSPDAFYSGNYLVTAVRHIITNRYITVLELAKESVPTPYASPDNNSPIWQNTVKGLTKAEVGVIE